MLRMIVRLALVASMALWTAGAGAQEDLYRFVEGDRIQVTVLEDPGLNSTALVRPDGRISLPLAGTIVVAGRTPEAVASVIRDALADNFIEPPTVSVALLDLGGVEEPGQVYVIGEVARPGAIPLPSGDELYVLQALAVVGGPGPFAATNRIQLRRLNDQGNQSVFLFDYEQVLDGAVPTAPLTLRDGDVIVVPEAGLFE